MFYSASFNTDFVHELPYPSMRFVGGRLEPMVGMLDREDAKEDDKSSFYLESA
jgi:hypothetical protein